MGRNADVKELATNLGVSSDYLRRARLSDSLTAIENPAFIAHYR
jgi:hypothetical protein